MREFTVAPSRGSRNVGGEPRARARRVEPENRRRSRDDETTYAEPSRATAMKTCLLRHARTFPIDDDRAFAFALWGDAAMGARSPRVVGTLQSSTRRRIRSIRPSRTANVHRVTRTGARRVERLGARAAMRVLVLGSSGLIGAPLVARLRRAGHDVTEWDVAIDRSHDLTDAANVPARAPRSIRSDFVFFLAFDVGAQYISTPTANFIHRNSLLMANTFGLLQGKRFVFASSTMSNMDVPYGTLKRLGEHYTSVLGGDLCSILECLRSSKVR